ncbi:hypothetical protein R1sor_025734 [Riccia sorocarpa]|uniref:AP2/ERF domain-containing protein n=1 Tax=Riccia sorocarpa TaxID=122646 RepID=A0ABD3GAT9_9MARC
MRRGGGPFNSLCVNKGFRQKKSGKWVAEFRRPGEKTRKWLGTFSRMEEAVKAYNQMSAEVNGTSVYTTLQPRHKYSRSQMNDAKRGSDVPQDERLFRVPLNWLMSSDFSDEIYAVITHPKRPESKETATDEAEVHTVGELNFDAADIEGAEAFTVGELNCNSDFDIWNYLDGKEGEHLHDGFDELDKILAEVETATFKTGISLLGAMEENVSLRASLKTSDGPNILPSAYKQGNESSLKELTSDDFIPCDMAYDDLYSLEDGRGVHGEKFSSLKIKSRRNRENVEPIIHET